MVRIFLSIIRVLLVLIIFSLFLLLYLMWVPQPQGTRYALVHFIHQAHRPPELYQLNNKVLFFWQNLIPGNVRILWLEDLSFQEDFLFEWNLPLSREEPALRDFRFLLEGTLAYQLNLEKISQDFQRAELQNMSQLNFSLAKIKEESRHLSMKWLNIQESTVNESDLIKTLEQELQVLSPYAKEVRISLKNFEQADLISYQEELRILKQRKEAHQRTLAQADQLNEEFFLREHRQIMWLERYGQLFEKYPRLLEFLNSPHFSSFTFWSEPQEKQKNQDLPLNNLDSENLSTDQDVPQFWPERESH